MHRFNKKARKYGGRRRSTLSVYFMRSAKKMVGDNAGQILPYIYIYKKRGVQMYVLNCKVACRFWLLSCEAKTRVLIMVPHGKRIRRPLGVVEHNSPIKKRVLQIKKVLASDDEVSVRHQPTGIKLIGYHNKSPSKLHIYNDKDVNDCKSATRVVYTSAAPEKLCEDGVVYELNKKNLNLQQAEILKFESMEPSCGHFLCHKRRLESLVGSRVWFLFELEMTTDGVSNLRDGCYFNRVYRRIIPKWEVASCLAAAVPKGYQPMPIEHLRIQSLPIISVGRFHKENTSVSDVSVQLDSIIEEPERPARRIPPTSLRSRYNTKTYGNVCINVASILNERKGQAIVQESKLAPTKKPESNRVLRMRSYFSQERVDLSAKDKT